MKKTLLYTISIMFVIFAILIAKFYEYKDQYNQIRTENLKYEKYINKEIKGTDIATLINQAVDDNEQNGVPKDENGSYIQNDENSVNINIKIKDMQEEPIYTMESLYNGGITEFVKYYGQIKFKCSETKYNSRGKISFLLLEQIK